MCVPLKMPACLLFQAIVSCRESAVVALQDTKADPAERHKMLQILQRIHEQEVAVQAELDSDQEADAGFAGIDQQADLLQQEGASASDDADEGLSEETLRKLKLQVYSM